MREIKIAALLMIICFSASIVFAMSDETQLQKNMLKNQKNVTNKIIDTQINNKMTRIIQVANDTKMSDEEKDKILKQYQNDIVNLKNQKTLNNYKYKKQIEQL